MSKEHKELDGLSPETIRAFFMGETRTRIIPADIEWRESGSGDNSRFLSGYAAKFNTRTVLYEGQGWRITEQIDPEFFNEVLTSRPDCHLNMGHDMNTAMARTGINGAGGLQLSVDDIGLRAVARLSASDPDVQRLASKMDLGVMDQMSFAFAVAEESLTVVTGEDGLESYDYTLLKCRNLYDVCVCAQGAYSTTEAALRSFVASQQRINNHPNNENGTVDNQTHSVARETADGTVDNQTHSVTAKDDGTDNSQVERQKIILQGQAAHARLNCKPRKDL